MSAPTVHDTAEVSASAHLGDGCLVWHQAQVREGASLGVDCIVGKGAYIDAGVTVGARCKIQNFACLYHGVTLEDGVFVGPAVVFTNDRDPRAITPEGALKSDEDWEVGATLVREGASVGARAVVLPGMTIGRWALVAAAAVVTRDVPDHALVVGSPAKQTGWVCRCARKLDEALRCPACGRTYERTAEGLALTGTAAGTTT